MGRVTNNRLHLKKIGMIGAKSTQLKWKTRKILSNVSGISEILQHFKSQLSESSISKLGLDLFNNENLVNLVHGMLRSVEEEEASDTDDENEGESETDQSEDETEEEIENEMLLDVLDDHHDAAKWPVEWRNSSVKLHKNGVGLYESSTKSRVFK